MKELASKFSYLLALTLMSTAISQQAIGQITPTPIEQLDSLLKVETKPVLILLSTDWCQYCQMQKAQIRKNKAFINNANKFHYIEFDAESKKAVIFNTKSYSYKPTGINIGTHELAEHLNGDSQLAYPTWVILNSQYEVLFRHKGVLLPKKIDELIKILSQ